MKKAIKKFMAALLAVAMLCVMAVPAFADSTAGNGKITINGAIEGQTYKIYRILNLETNAAYNAYKYTINDGWEDFVAAHTDVFSVNNGIVTLADDSITDNSAKIQALANAAGQYAATKNLPTAATATSDNNTVSGLPLGYYLVVSDPALSANSLCSLGTTDPEATINEKNGKPGIDKKVEYAPGSTGSTNDATVGDTVNFVVTITVTDGQPEKYIMHDEMDKGLHFNGTVVVKRGGETLTDGIDYTLDTAPVDGHTFDVKFIDGKLHTNDVITITYSATLTKDAVVGSTGNNNKSTLSYGENNSVDSTTRTYTWSFNIFKFFKNGSQETRLAGAEFELYRKNGETIEYAMIENGKITGWDTDENNASKFVSTTDSDIAISGIAGGTYFLKETQTPAGYNPLENDVEIHITAENWNNLTNPSMSLTYNGTTAENATVKVENKTGTTLPSTGGMGTTLFYVIGGGLMVAAAVLLITKKRMENK